MAKKLIPDDIEEMSFEEALSELDSMRSKMLLELLERLSVQTFITTTEIDMWSSPHYKDCHIIRVQDGEIL